MTAGPFLPPFGAGAPDCPPARVPRAPLDHRYQAPPPISARITSHIQARKEELLRVGLAVGSNADASLVSASVLGSSSVGVEDFMTPSTQSGRRAIPPADEAISTSDSGGQLEYLRPYNLLLAQNFGAQNPLGRLSSGNRQGSMTKTTQKCKNAGCWQDLENFSIRVYVHVEPDGPIGTDPEFPRAHTHSTPRRELECSWRNATERSSHSSRSPTICLRS